MYQQHTQKCSENAITKHDYPKLNVNSNPRILFDISRFYFENMIFLALNDNKISSLEQLIHVKAPGLQLIDLEVNLITNIKSLRKCDFPQLRSITLTDNHINDFSSFSQVKSPGLNFIGLQYLVVRTNGENINWLFKNETPVLKQIRLLRNAPRIKTTKFEDLLKVKYNDIIISN